MQLYTLVKESRITFIIKRVMISKNVFISALVSQAKTKRIFGMAGISSSAGSTFLIGKSGAGANCPFKNVPVT